MVTNILILQKKDISFPIYDEITRFVSINKTLNITTTDEEIAILYENILTDNNDETFNTIAYRTINIIDIDLNWNTLFSDISWLDEIKEKLIYANELFDINRGERRGCNPMFYPKNGHGIEAEYIKSVLRTPKEIKSLIAEAKTDAFCCSKSIEELKTLNHIGALTWIQKFEYKSTIIAKSSKKDSFWYEMGSSSMADLVISLNPDKRIFIAKFNKKSFVDQRLIRFRAKKNIDIDLTHALFNSILGIFFIESLGFSRGLGALDLSSTRMKKHLRILNPEALTEKQIQLIKDKFMPIKDREIKNIEDELKDKDRIKFDNTVLKAFGILNLKDKIVDSFLYLYNMRKNSRD